MNLINIDELEKKDPDASDIDLAINEIERLQRVDKLNTKLVNLLMRLNPHIREFYFATEADDLIAEAKEISDV